MLGLSICISMYVISKYKTKHIYNVDSLHKVNIYLYIA